MLKLWTLREVCEHYGLSEHHVKLCIANGLIPAFRIESQYRFDPAELPADIPEPRQCAAVTRWGLRCERPVFNGADCCWQHQGVSEREAA